MELIFSLLAQGEPQSGAAKTYGIVGLVVLVVVVFLALMATRRRGLGPLGALDLDPLARLKAGLHKTRGGFLANLRSLVARHLDEQTLDALGDVLLAADMGPETAQRLVADLKQAFREKKFEKQDQMIEFLKKDLAAKLGGERPKLVQAQTPPTVILVMGVNGTGKTTSVAKITRFLARDGKKVLLAASDTFRAAAVEQLSRWTEKLNTQFREEAAKEAAAAGGGGAPAAVLPKTATIEIVKGEQGADPASVAHDACEKAIAKGFDYVLIDTAGRLHTAKNLMTELEKIARVVKKKIPDAPHESLLVLDATTGQNAIRQAQEFTQAIPITGIFLAKLDGTAKGGIVVAIRHHLDIPVKFIGIGEGPDDIQTFDAERFAEALFS
ncbi:MAG TPA: signaling recognition particle receptor family protein [Planctomycetota bacterium]|nr:signaling recognition particle receptor family protein [Planctomycetota bacterium]